MSWHVTCWNYSLGNTERYCSEVGLPTRNLEWLHGHRGFESHPLRQSSFPPFFAHIQNGNR